MAKRPKKGAKNSKFQKIVATKGFSHPKLYLGQFLGFQDNLKSFFIKNMISRYRDFKSRDPFLAEIGLVLLNISQNWVCIRYFWVLNDTNHGDTWKPSKTKSKTIFGSKKSLFGPFMRYHFYIGKSPISTIPSRTQTRISWVRNWILTFRKERWLRIEKSSFIRTQHVFWPLYPPHYGLNFQTTL